MRRSNVKMLFPRKDPVLGAFVTWVVGQSETSFRGTHIVVSIRRTFLRVFVTVIV